MIKIFFISFTFLMFTRSAIISENCNSMLLTEEHLKSFEEVTENLKTFLKRNLEDQNSMRRVLNEHDPTLSRTITIKKNSSNDEILLQHQSGLHQEMKEMFSEIKQLILSHKPSDFAESKIENYREKNDEKKDSTVKCLDSRPADCSDLLVPGPIKSGIYTIYPSKCGCAKPVKVFCDMDTDGGGWTIFLSRMKTSKPVNFTRNWEDYKNGFGTAENEYWIGNEALHIMTATKNYILRIEAKDGFGRATWGEWNSFSVSSEDDKYRLLVNSYNSKSEINDTYSFSYVNETQFSTFDQDNDKSERFCSELFKGGWWYNDCFYINPTGIYGRESKQGIKINSWSRADDETRYATWLQLKIRPKF